jgi:hypothetical protein
MAMASLMSVRNGLGSRRTRPTRYDDAQ